MNLKPVNEQIGTWICPLGGEAKVYQTKKQGRHFYTHCECCKLTQGTGAARQQRIYDEAVFIDKSSVAIPKGVNAGAFIDNEMVGQDENKLDENPEKKPADFDSSEMVEETVEVREGFFSKLAPFAVVAAAIGVGLWMN